MGSLYTSPQIPWWEGDACSPPHDPAPAVGPEGLEFRPFRPKRHPQLFNFFDKSSKGYWMNGLDVGNKINVHGLRYVFNRIFDQLEPTNSRIFFPLLSPRSCHRLSTAGHRLSMLLSVFFSQENISFYLTLNGSCSRKHYHFFSNDNTYRVPNLLYAFFRYTNLLSNPNVGFPFSTFSASNAIPTYGRRIKMGGNIA